MPFSHHLSVLIRGIRKSDYWMVAQKAGVSVMLPDIPLTTSGSKSKEHPLDIGETGGKGGE